VPLLLSSIANNSCLKPNPCHTLLYSAIKSEDMKVPELGSRQLKMGCVCCVQFVNLYNCKMCYGIWLGLGWGSGQGQDHDWS